MKLTLIRSPLKLLKEAKLKNWYNKDRTQLRSPLMEGCDPAQIKQENERVHKREHRRKLRKEKRGILKEFKDLICTMINKQYRKKKR